MKIGIQGGRGSNNEQAVCELCKKEGISDFEIVYLFQTKKVLQALLEKKIDRGFFAKNSGAKIVAETNVILPKYEDRIEEICEYNYLVKHSVFARIELPKEDYLMIHSHIQALGVHAEYIWQNFPNVALKPEVDTSLAADLLAQKKLPVTSLAIAPSICADIFPDLKIINKWLPPHDYITTFSFVKRK